jgi:hypothetical protein
VEIGAKQSVSLNGDSVACVDHLRWDAFNEGGDLESQIEAYCSPMAIIRRLRESLVKARTAITSITFGRSDPILPLSGSTASPW